MSNYKISDEDKKLFRDMMKDVSPLKKNKKISSNTKPKKLHQTKKLASTPQYFLSDYYSEPVQSESIIYFCQPSIPSKHWQTLKKGLIPWQDQLDLHGLTSDSAKARVCDFIRDHLQKGSRSLLIIHGKGSYAGEPPILKNLVNTWLKQIPEVLAYHSARPKDGGTGALYLLLKRKRL